MTEYSLPFVSVIIPVLNGERTIRDCLVSLLRMDYPPERREILVVDNGSTDRTAEIIKSLPVSYLHEDRKGASYARNRGIEASKGEILAFTDADCVVTSGWLRELVERFENEEVGAVEGETVAYPTDTPLEQFQGRTSSYARQIRLESPLAPYVILTNVAFRREVFQRIGLFDPRFPAAGGEDIDFSWRFFQEIDLALRFSPKAVVFHRHRSTVWGFFSQQMRNGRGLAVLRSKYQSKDRKGASYARNRGIEASKGEILAFTDADCVVTSGWLRELVERFENEEVGAVEGETVAYPTDTPLEQFQGRTSSYARQIRLESPLAPYVILTNVAFRREVFQRIGLFDPRFPAAGGEDIDFSWRFFQEIDLALRFSPKAVVFHRHRSTVWGFFSQQMRNGRGLAVLRSKYQSKLPWCLRKELLSWAAVTGLALVATRKAIQGLFLGRSRMEVYDSYFAFIRKLAIRIGFLWGALAGDSR